MGTVDGFSWLMRCDSSLRQRLGGEAARPHHYIFYALISHDLLYFPSIGRGEPVRHRGGESWENFQATFY